ncbi:MAG: dTMP kinase [Armatimonadota bacterium]|nr:dTMP kinase [bacterium]
MTNRSGFFLTLEGIEGSGKSTLAGLLAEHFASAGMEVVVTAEPGGCAVGEAIRQLVLHSTEPISDNAELLLFEAARAQHVQCTILPALQRGAIVICDRFTDSSLAYQGYARGIDINIIKTLNDFATGGLTPDLTILLDLPAEVGLARQVKMDRVSSERLAFHEAVREGYLAIAKAEPERVVVISAEMGVEDVLREAIIVLEHARSKEK